jgi:hypothetical protein
MYISGSIGITVLKKDKKIITIFADDHSKNIYCNEIKTNKKIKVVDLLKILMHKNQVLLEEVDNNDFNLEELWGNVEHTKELKKLYLDNNEKITPIDIRPFLIPFTISLSDLNEKSLNKTLTEYLEMLDEFFNLKGNFFNNKFLPMTYKIESKYRNCNIAKHIKQLYNRYKEFIIKYKSKLNQKIRIVNKDKELVNDLEELYDATMEFYTILLIFTKSQNSFIHSGLFHTDRIIDILINLYGFKIIYQNGINEMFEKNLDYKSCIFVNDVEQFFY